ncbi:50S ribosomal protein L22 [bacterium]|nr:50S ribosomal protein L22 [bacterium]
MTVITAQQKNVRQSSRKVRLVANQVRKMELAAAVAALAVMERRSSMVILKVINQAIANATKNMSLSVGELELVDIVVDDGPILRRMRAVSRGRGHGIDKRTCHVRVVLRTKDENKAGTSVKTVSEADTEGKK